MIRPTHDGVPLSSGKHTGQMRELMFEERTVGDLVAAKEKPSLLFSLLNLYVGNNS